MFGIHSRTHGPRVSLFRWEQLDLVAIENEHGAGIIEFRHKATDIDVLWKNSGWKEYPLWGNCNVVTLQPSTSPSLPFEQLCKTNQLHWLEPRGSLSTSLSSGFCSEPDKPFLLPRYSC